MKYQLRTKAEIGYLPELVEEYEDGVYIIKPDYGFINKLEKIKNMDGTKSFKIVTWDRTIVLPADITVEIVLTED